jgi:hypothetical protein
MQADNLSALDFSKRTDALAARLGISLRTLCVRAGISQPMLFGYRSGKHPITAKALRKIEALEATASGPPDEHHAEQVPFGGLPPAPKPTGQFAAYLAFIAQCRDEALRLAGGDPDKAAPIFDRILEVWHQSRLVEPTTPPHLPFPQPGIQRKNTNA